MADSDLESSFVIRERIIELKSNEENLGVRRIRKVVEKELKRYISEKRVREIVRSGPAPQTSSSTPSTPLLDHTNTLRPSAIQGPALGSPSAVMRTPIQQRLLRLQARKASNNADEASQNLDYTEVSSVAQSRIEYSFSSASDAQSQGENDLSLNTQSSLEKSVDNSRDNLFLDTTTTGLVQRRLHKKFTKKESPLHRHSSRGSMASPLLTPVQTHTPVSTASLAPQANEVQETNSCLEFLYSLFFA